MEHEPKTYFTENEQDDVKGFTVLDANDGEYHIAEKWLKSGEEPDVWMDYWIPEAQLLKRAESGDCEPVAELSDEQFEQVCGLVGWDYTDAEAGEAVA